MFNTTTVAPEGPNFGTSETKRRVSVSEARLPAHRFEAKSFGHRGDPRAIEAAIDTSAWNEGYAAAKAEAEAEHKALLQLLSSAEALAPEPIEGLAGLIAETVYTLVSDIVGEVIIDEQQLLRRAKNAIALIQECDDAQTIAVNPEDLPFIEDANLGLTAVGDPSLERGSIRIDCSPGWIEHGNSIFLERLRRELKLPEQHQ